MDAEPRLDVAVREFADAAGLAIAWYDVETGGFVASDALRAIFGFGPDDPPLPVDYWRRHVHPDDRESGDRDFDRFVTGEPFDVRRVRVVLDDGTVRWLSANPRSYRSPEGELLVVSVVWDETDSVLAERRTANLVRALRTSNRISTALISATDEAALISSACRAMVESGRYEFAWFGRRDHGADRLIVEEAYTGVPDRLPDVVVSWGDDPGVEAPMGEAVRSGEPQVVQDVSAPGEWEEWRSLMAGRGIGSYAVLPLVVDGVVHGGFGVGAREPNSFEDDVLGVLIDAAALVGFGVSSLRAGRREAVAQQAAADAERERAELADRLVLVGSQERAQLALDLHDDPIQRLAAALLHLDRARQGAHGEMQEVLDQVDRLMRGSVRSLRRLIFELTPPDLDVDGVAASLETCAVQLFAGGPVELSVVLEGTDDVALSDREAALLYRLGAEALGNVRRHADARRVQLVVRRADDVLHLEVVDDGVGFDPDRASGPGHLGLRSMADRARLLNARLAVDSRPGSGTRVSIAVPIDGDADGNADTGVADRP